MCKYLIRFPQGAGEDDLVLLNLTYFHWAAPHIFIGDVYNDNATILSYTRSSVDGTENTGFVIPFPK